MCSILSLALAALAAGTGLFLGVCGAILMWAILR